ncbi:MAG: DUF3857 and transglutaminase domain-containing protein [Ignavibacteriaceae bacterium]|nr:DUF3857 and transglutaminase domain-containing protein [Ignavibacteriaceae bacterium]
MRYFQSFLLLCLSLVLASCSSGNFLDYKDVALKYNLPKSVGAGDYPEDDGVVLLSTTDINMELYTHTITTDETVHRIKKLFKNIENHAFIEIPIYNGEKLEKISARTVKSDGTVIQLKPEEFYTSSGVEEGSTFYSDMKNVKFTFPAIEKNCIIEYEYTKSKLHPFRTDVWYIHDNMPTLFNKYSLSVPKILLLSEINGGAGWNWNYKAYNYALDNPEVDDQKAIKDMGKAKIINTWILRNIEPMKEEEMMPAVQNHIGYVKFADSDWKKWDDISKWYYKELFEPRLIVSSEIKDLAQKLTGDIENKTEKVRKLYDYVKNLRYVSISLGVGSIQPSEPADILKRQYGDCKDKSILLISLLKAAGIESQPVLVLTSDEGTLDPYFPSWNFNHMIVKATVSSKESYWLDATAKYTPFGKLPWPCQDINVLVLNSDYTSGIERTLSSDLKDNVRYITLNMDLKNDGTVAYDVELKYYGDDNSYIRYRLEDKTDKELKEYCKSLIADDFTNAVIQKCDLSDIDSLKTSYSLKFHGTAGNIMQNQSDLVLVSSDPFKFFENTSWLIKDKREFPIKFDYPFILNKSIIINLPQGYSVRNLPGKVNQNIANMNYSKEISSSGNAINLNEKFRMSNSLVQPSKYQETRQFFEGIKNNYGEKIILIKK